MIVADNKENEDPEYLIMADDGRGSSVTIPSFLISRSDGKKLAAAVHEWLEEGQGPKGGPPEGRDPNEGKEGGAGEGPDGEGAWNGRKRGGGGRGGGHGRWAQRVIIKAEIDLATKTKGTVNTDMWYANIYELYNSGWDLARFAEIQEIFKARVKIHPRLITNSCNKCTDEEKSNLCV